MSCQSDTTSHIHLMHNTKFGPLFNCQTLNMLDVAVVLPTARLSSKLGLQGPPGGLARIWNWYEAMLALSEGACALLCCASGMSLASS